MNTAKESYVIGWWAENLNSWNANIVILFFESIKISPTATQRWVNVASASWSCIDVDGTLYKRYMLAGYITWPVLYTI